MKKLLLFITTFACVVFLNAQSPAEQALYLQLSSKGDDSVTALKEILDKPGSASAVMLYTASGVALREKRLEDSGFLFYVARFRAQFDRELFPPTGTGGDSPMVLFGALQQQLGSVVNPALMAEPKVFAKVLARVRSWRPEVPNGYLPGWEFSQKESPKKAEASIQDGRTKFLDGMGGICTLLQDDAYFAAFKIAQDYNLKPRAEKPTKEAFDAAMKMMERIESEKGIQGVATKTKK
ncbi:MAG: hypothetical protein RLZZ15_422 [Verrucomicrobiota bacterium]|jgi:hypothetical protein